jgi:predicted nucleic acid-binding protein
MSSRWLLDSSALLALRDDEDERNGRLADAQLQSLPITWVPCSDALLEQAAAIKANHRLSVADAWIASAAPILIPCLPC